MIQKEKSIYYLSPTLISYEINHPQIEKACLAVVFAFQKLPHYLLNNQTMLISRFEPITDLLYKPELTGRMAN